MADWRERTNLSIYKYSQHIASKKLTNFYNISLQHFLQKLPIPSNISFHFQQNHPQRAGLKRSQIATIARVIVYLE